MGEWGITGNLSQFTTEALQNSRPALLKPPLKMTPLRGLSLFYVANLVIAARPKPLFSWATVPLFQHLASVNATFSQAFPPARLQWLAKSYPLVVLEHAQGQGHWAYTTPSGPGSVWGPAPFAPPSGYIEDHFAHAAEQLKELNSSVVVLYYQQITGALPYYRASGPVMTTGPLGSDCKPNMTSWLSSPNTGGARPLGDILPNYVTYDWDHTQPGVQAAFVSSFLNVTATTKLDGTFIDTSQCYGDDSQTNASIATVVAMQQAAPDKIVGFHTDSDMSGASGWSASMDYTFAQPSVKSTRGKSKDTSGKAAVAWLAANYLAGALSLAHIGDVDQGSDM